MSEFLKKYYYKEYIFIFIFLFLFIAGYVWFENSREAPLDISVVDIEEKGALGDLEEDKEKSKLKLSVSGKVKGDLEDDKRPLVKVDFSVSNENSEKYIEKTVGLNYESSFELKDLEVTKGDKVTVELRSPDYAFLPPTEEFNVSKSSYNLTFKAVVRETTTKENSIKGSVSFAKEVKGVVYALGWSSLNNERIKEITSIDPNGNFEFTGLESGTYIIVPDIENVLLIPESKKVNIINEDVQIRFVGVKNVFD